MIITIITALILIYLFVSLILGYFVARFLINCKRQDIDQKLKQRGIKSEEELIDAKYKTKIIDIECFDKIHLEAKLFYTDSIEDKCIIISHGFGGSRIMVYKYANMFLELGYNALVYNMRHSATAEGKFTTMGHKESMDIESIVLALKDIGVKTIISFGISMGASSSLLHSLKYASVDKCIADCPFARLDKQIKRRIRHYVYFNFPSAQFCNMFLKLLANFSYKDLDILKLIDNKAEKINTKYLLIHGSEDELIPSSDSEEIVERLGDKASIYICKGAKHVKSFDTDTKEYKNRIKEFLKA